ncbi:probable pectin methyltransferase QUA2 [Phalaenopsis equestris]|uniref:probable pectin methyltransferase QUA2 n=1 Tax=Phalaenopsis equestris TaxID=78828 RepID=UPI0009E322F7|nr:probable pectin methyltransferase QUA2 [Phalaenopsis equestris]
MLKASHRGPYGSNGRPSGCNLEGDSFDKHNNFTKNGSLRGTSSPFGKVGKRQHLNLNLLKLGLALVSLAALCGSLCWITYISSASQVDIYRGYRRLRDRLIADLSVVGELSHGVGKLKELEFCPQEYENYVPCYYNFSENLDSREADQIDYQRQCVRGLAKGLTCLVLPPKNYRIPLRWPIGRDFIWKENVKISGHEFSSGSLTKRMMVEEEHISFHSDSLMVDGVEDYSHQIAEMIGLRNESNFNEAGVRTVLDIGCGFGSFGAHLFSKQVLTMCIANYEASGSQVQITLERGLPAMIGSFSSKQLPYPHLSFDMVHCARCGIDWENNDGIFLVEVDRLLRPGGYFVWTSVRNSNRSLRDKNNHKKWTLIRDFAQNLCWEMLSQQEETIIWKKTSKKKCYRSRKAGPPVCGKSQDIESPYYQQLYPCVGGLRSQRWIPIENRTPWPSQANLNSAELSIHGVHQEDFVDDSLYWNAAIHNYWSLLSPLVFSDHPKRPGDEDPSPPFNMLRNVLDMNSQFGGFNAALLESGKSVWVMNVVPTTSYNYLPLILDRGFIGVQHDWCDAFPTYPRTYDAVLAKGLLSTHQQHRCSIPDIFLEVDRILRPEGWVIVHDSAPLVELLRSVITQMRWEARMVEIEANKDERLLICQKPFFRKQPQ